MNFFALFLPSVESAAILMLPIIGMYLTSRILHIDDLTIEGSFGLAGAVTATLLWQNTSPFVAVIIAILVAGCAGLCTALIHATMRISVLMSSIIVSTGIFSCNLLIAGANLSLAQKTTIFSYGSTHKILLLSNIALCSIFLIRIFLNTNIGFFIRAAGANPSMVAALGKRPICYTIIGIVLANMLTGLAGSLFVQYLGFYSIWSSVGIMITTLAGLMLAELISEKIGVHLFIGALFYQLILLLTFELQCNADWNKLITALCIVALLSIKRFVLEEHQS